MKRARKAAATPEPVLPPVIVIDDAMRQRAYQAAMKLTKSFTADPMGAIDAILKAALQPEPEAPAK